MVTTIRAILSGLIIGLAALALAPLFASAQITYGQLIVVTRVSSGSSLPSSATTITVTGTGPSLTSTPTALATLTYGSNYNNDTRIVTMTPGSYSVSSAGLSGYTLSYSSQCTGSVAGNEVRTCTIIATGNNTGTSDSRVNVSVNVINDNGGTRTSSDFVVTVTGTNTSVSNFQGTAGSVQVSLGAGAYSIDALSTGAYSVSRTSDCSGTIGSNETRSCLITLNDNGSTYNPYNPNLGRLSCTPARQSATIGSTVSFTATGGNGVYTWSTADRTFYGVGNQLNATLGTRGTQSVYVTSGYETASCVVDMVGGGTVLGTGTQIPGLPNTGFAPTMLGTILALIAAFVAFPIAAVVSYRHVRKTLTAIVS